MLTQKPHTFIACDADFEAAKTVLFGAPFDSTTSYRPGSRFAPAAIRGESYGIETFSPYQNKDLADIAVFDSGDLELPFGSPEKALELIKRRAAAILNADKLPFMLGGEHLVTLGAVCAAAEKYPDLHLIHFDAHADLRDDYLGQKLSHACVMRRCHALLGNGKIFQFGIRSGDRSEFEWSAGRVFTQRFNFEGLSETVKCLSGKPVYFTLDLDVLDPSGFCGTGTPEAGGVSFMQLLNAVFEVCRLNIVGLDINELSPPLDQSGASTALACKLTRELLLAV
jgi:agmatinase